ncbi:unnamed protein product [Coffea canephora]|uniref:Uncharacterized protein n=1 Tax=Coffea canephora TaxID=49390 RepID=A0A068TTT6_COFCA|nr:unnamed protein product [Coffea canephora]
MENLGFANLTLGAAAAVEEHQGKANDDPFERLSDELIVSHILDKVSEAKYLCRCSLVSKRFSSLVFVSKSVSLKIPVEMPVVQPDPTPRLAAFPGKPVHAVTYPMGFLQLKAYKCIRGGSSPPHCAFDADLMLDYLPKFLGKFTELKSLAVEFDYSASGVDGNLNFAKQPVIKWTFDPEAWCFVLVIAPRSIDEVGENIYARESDLHQIVSDVHVGIFVCSCIIMGGLVRLLSESLAQVVITDSKKQGRIDFGETDIVEITSKVRPFMTAEEDSKLLLKIWEESTFEQLQEMHAISAAFASLPAPDMKVTSFFLGKGKAKGKGKGNKGKGKSKARGNEGDCDDDYQEVKKAFQGPQAFCLNAVMEMLKEIRGSF